MALEFASIAARGTLTDHPGSFEIIWDSLIGIPGDRDSLKRKDSLKLVMVWIDFGILAGLFQDAQKTLGEKIRLLFI